MKLELTEQEWDLIKESLFWSVEYYAEEGDVEGRETFYALLTKINKTETRSLQ